MSLASRTMLTGLFAEERELWNARKKETAKTAETAGARGLRRRRNGHFAKGNRGGPGRPVGSGGSAGFSSTSSSPVDVLDLDDYDLSFIPEAGEITGVIEAKLIRAGIDVKKLRRIIGGGA